MAVGKVVRSSQWGGDVHPPGTANVPVAPKRQEKLPCTALTKSSKGAALPCPQEEQRGSCIALPEILNGAKEKNVDIVKSFPTSI